MTITCRSSISLDFDQSVIDHLTLCNMVNNREYPPSLSEAESHEIQSTIKDWSIAHGLAVRPPPTFVTAEADPHGVLATTVPVTLFPSPFPRVCFEQAKIVQSAYNQLYASIAQDEEFLTEIAQEYVRKNSAFVIARLVVFRLFRPFP